MKTNIKFIKFFSITSGVTFVACYIASLFTFEKPWVNSNFLFSVFSGVFASFIVVLITEIKKYFDNKSMTENCIYGNCVGLYIELTGQIKQLDMYLKNKEELLPGAILEHRMPSLASYNNGLRLIDYTTMRKKNALFHLFTTFVQQEVPKVEQHLINCNNLQIAVNQTQINYLKQGISGYNPTSADPLVNIAVQKIKASAEAQRVAIDGFLQTLVSFYPNRFNWENEKASINQVCYDIQEMQKNNKEFFES